MTLSQALVTPVDEIIDSMELAPHNGFTTATSHLRDVLGDETYEALARKGEAMTTAEMVAYAYDQIDQGPERHSNAVSMEELYKRLDSRLALLKCHRVHKRLRQVKSVSPATHRYVEVTADRCHSPGTPLSSCAPRSSNSSPDPITRSRSVLTPAHVVRSGQCAHACADVHGDPPRCRCPDFAFAGVQPGADLDAECLHRVANCHGTDRSLGSVEHREETIPRCAHLAAPKAGEL